MDLRTFSPPEESKGYFLGAKPFGAAAAERDAAGESLDLLILLAPNTLLLSEPQEMMLARGKDFAFSPVHHQNVGSYFEEEPDAWWRRIYEVLGVGTENIWPMETVADRRILRPYFSSGSISVRPELGLMASWAEAFVTLYRDSEIAEASADGPQNVFLHQAALAAVVVKSLPRRRILQLSYRYNYPLFFDRFFGAPFSFDSLEEVATMRYEFSFDALPQGWEAGVRAPEGVLEWITNEFFAKGG